MDSGKMIFIKLLIMVLCGALMSWGGYSWKPARRFILPCLLTTSALFLTHQCWCLCMLCSILALSFGYGDNSALRHIFGPSWARSVYGLLAAICLSLPLFLTHHLGLPFEVHLVSVSVDALISLCIYLSLNFTLENALKNINQVTGDLIIGAGLSSIVLLVHP